MEILSHSSLISGFCHANEVIINVTLQHSQLRLPEKVIQGTYLARVQSFHASLTQRSPNQLRHSTPGKE